MRLSRTDFAPLLAIVAGGVIGASLSFGLLGRSPAVDVPAPNPVVAPSVTKETARRLEDLQRLLESNDRTEEVRRLLERDRMERVEEIREVFIIDSHVRIR